MRRREDKRIKKRKKVFKKSGIVVNQFKRKILRK